MKHGSLKVTAFQARALADRLDEIQVLVSEYPLSLEECKYLDQLQKEVFCALQNTLNIVSGVHVRKKLFISTQDMKEKILQL